MENVTQDVIDSNIENFDNDNIIQETEDNNNKPENIEKSENNENPLVSETDLIGADGEKLTDSEGNTFDSSLHLVDEDNKPKLTQKGKLRKKRQTKKSKLANSSAAQIASNVANSEAERFRIVGASMAGSLITLGVLVGGEDFVPVKNNIIDEQKNMELAFAEWAKTKEIEDLPPNLTLAITLGAYLLPRLSKPKQLSKFKMLGLWFRAKFTKKPAGAAFDPNKQSKEG